MTRAWCHHQVFIWIQTAAPHLTPHFFFQLSLHPSLYFHLSLKLYQYVYQSMCLFLSATSLHVTPIRHLGDVFLFFNFFYEWAVLFTLCQSYFCQRSDDEHIQCDHSTSSSFTFYPLIGWASLLNGKGFEVAHVVYFWVCVCVCLFRFMWARVLRGLCGLFFCQW